MSMFQSTNATKYVYKEVNMRVQCGRTTECSCQLLCGLFCDYPGIDYLLEVSVFIWPSTPFSRKCNISGLWKSTFFKQSVPPVTFKAKLLQCPHSGLCGITCCRQYWLTITINFYDPWQILWVGVGSSWAGQHQLETSSSEGSAKAGDSMFKVTTYMAGKGFCKSKKHLFSLHIGSTKGYLNILMTW